MTAVAPSTRAGGGTGSALDANTRLERLAVLATRAGTSPIARDARELSARLSEGRFYVACFGQFKRGKSTLINALLDEELLPVGVVPVTTVVTVLRHGTQRAARVRLAGQPWESIDPSTLADYAAEELNPANQKGVEALEVFHPSPLLASGLCLVDTPGVGSVFAGASEATRAFVPHVDAAIVVVGGDPPISGEEVDLFEDLASQVDVLIPLLNKADRLSETECREARAFAERILSDRLRCKIDPVLEISARERLLGTGPERDWPAFLQRLHGLAGDRGSDLIELAEQRGVEVLAERLLHELEELRGALTRPVAESEQRSVALRECAAAAERSLSDLNYMLLAEQERLGAEFSRRRDQFLRDALPAGRKELVERIRTATSERGPALRRRAYSFAQEICRGWVDRWRDVEQPAAEQMYRSAAQRFVELANGFLSGLAASGTTSLATLPGSLGPELGFRVRSGLFYTEMTTLTSGSPLRWLLDWLRSRQSLLRSVERGATDYLERLLEANTARVRSDFDERVLESRRRLEGEVRGLLQEVHASAERALATTRAHVASGAAAVADELRRVDGLRESVMALRAMPCARSGDAGVDS